MAYNVNKDGGKLHIFLGISALVCFLASSSILPFFDKGAPGGVPDAMLCFVCALPAFTDIKKGGIYALCLGFAADLFVTPPTSLSPFVFLLCMCLSYACLKHFSRVGSLAIAICTLPSFAVKSLVSAIITSFTVDGVNLWKAISNIPFMSFISNFACAIVVAFVMRLISKKMRINTHN